MLRYELKLLLGQLSFLLEEFGTRLELLDVSRCLTLARYCHLRRHRSVVGKHAVGFPVLFVIVLKPVFRGRLLVFEPLLESLVLTQNLVGMHQVSLAQEAAGSLFF